MSEKTITQQQEDAVSGCCDEHPHDRVSRLLSQASAMTTMIYGNGAEGFHQWSLEMKDNYLWALADKIDEVVEAFDHSLANA